MSAPIFPITIIIPRYFTDGTSFWKFVEGESPKTRHGDNPEWGRSGFKTLEKFLAASGEVTEVTPEVAEP